MRVAVEGEYMGDFLVPGTNGSENFRTWNWVNIEINFPEVRQCSCRSNGWVSPCRDPIRRLVKCGILSPLNERITACGVLPGPHALILIYYICRCNISRIQQRGLYARDKSLLKTTNQMSSQWNCITSELAERTREKMTFSIQRFGTGKLWSFCNTSLNSGAHTVQSCRLRLFRVLETNPVHPLATIRNGKWESLLSWTWMDNMKLRLPKEDREDFSPWNPIHSAPRKNMSSTPIYPT